MPSTFTSHNNNPILSINTATMSEKMEVEAGYQNKEDVVVSTSTDMLSPEEDRKLLRKTDLCLLLVLAVSYIFQFLDKSALSGTAVLGIRKDLHLVGSDYSWASSIYYFGYLIASYPAGMIMVRWKVGKTITAAIFIWGAILMLTALCVNAGGLLAVRFFLGVSEAPIAPGLSIVVSMWYKRSEQPLRHAAWFLGNTTAGIFGNLLAYGIGHIEGFPAWKAVFLIFGGVTVAWSFAVFFLLPDHPLKAWFLSSTDRVKAITRVQENMTGVKNDEFKWYQCFEALLDVKTWLIAIIQLASNIPNGGITSFGSLVISGLGFGELNTLAIGILTYIFQLFFILLATGGSSYLKNTRTYFMAFNFVISIIGVSLVRQLPEHMKWSRFIGFCLAGTFTANFPLVMAMISGNFGGFTKKVSVNAVVFIGYCTGNIVGPQLFFSWQAPSYSSGFLAMLVCYVVGIATCFALRFYLAWENRRRDRTTTGVEGSELQDGVTLSHMDKTDKENPHFRYIY